MSGLSLSFSYFFVGSGLVAGFLTSIPGFGTKMTGAGSFFTGSVDFLMPAYSVLADMLLSTGLGKRL